jgi:hypothetical protein
MHHNSQPQNTSKLISLENIALQTNVCVSRIGKAYLANMIEI